MSYRPRVPWRASVAGLCWVLIPGCILNWTPPSGEEPDSGVDPYCGDGVRDPGETCDGNDLGGESCQDQGFDTGQLRCAQDCSLDTSRCEMLCGNGVLDGTEQCDGTELAGQDCQSLGLMEGTLACYDACTFDLSSCSGCGNGLIEPDEACDGTELGDLSCTGTLACRSDCFLDTSGCDFPSVGDGSGGPLDVSSTVNLSGAAAAAYLVTAIDGNRITVSSSPSALWVGDAVIIINMRGDTNDFSRVGIYEFRTVTAISGSDVVLDDVLQNGYGVNGDNGNLTGQRIVVQRVLQYSTLTIRPGGQLTVSAWDGLGGLLVLRVSELLEIQSGGQLHVNAKGYRGGVSVTVQQTDGRQGESICGNPQAQSTLANRGGGGGGNYTSLTSGDCGQGGGGGGYGSTGFQGELTGNCLALGNVAAANGGALYGDLAPPLMFMGSGAGSGALDNPSTASGSGGAGGGILMVYATRMMVSGTINAQGGNGSQSAGANDAGNGGGGAGGTIYLRVGELLGSGSISAAGGTGGASASNYNSRGGNGSYGRVRIDYLTAGGYPFGSPEAEVYLEGLVSPDAGYTSIFLE